MINYLNFLTKKKSVNCLKFKLSKCTVEGVKEKLEDYIYGDHLLRLRVSGSLYRWCEWGSIGRGGAVLEYGLAFFGGGFEEIFVPLFCVFLSCSSVFECCTTSCIMMLSLFAPPLWSYSLYFFVFLNECGLFIFLKKKMHRQAQTL